MKRYSIFLILGILLLKKNELKVEKFEISNKYLLKISYQERDSDYMSYSAGYSLKPFTFLSDSLKIELIEKLLSFENDTSICYNKVTCLIPQYYRGNNPKSLHYELQVEALHMINFIAFTHLSYFYSPFPVLYDMNSKKEIVSHSSGLKDVFSLYRKWFAKIKKKGFVNYRFPLRGSQYKWYGGKQHDMFFTKYPNWPKDAPGDPKTQASPLNY